jgi:2-amino-4-hydroxy-6-hydroxymethyldihydropteridine diphosphokinase
LVSRFYEGTKTLPELALIELGSNIKPGHHIPLAIGQLATLGEISSVSHIYRTKPFGPPGQPDFVNCAVGLRTALSPTELRQALRTIEAKLGRRRAGDKYAPRSIDLDLCMYGQRHGEIDGHTLPDPDILRRPYLAKTLAQVAPGTRHPGTGQTLHEIANAAEPGAVIEPLPAIEAAVDEILKTSKVGDTTA